MFFDFILVLSINYLLKRNSKLYKLLLSSVFGSLSTFLLFFRIDSLFLFFIKIILSIIMVLIAFGYNNLRYTLKNLYYLYFISILLGGFLYFLDTNIYSKHVGVLFINSNYSYNFIIMIIITPLIVILYIKNKKEEYKYEEYYNVQITLNNKKMILNGFLDTGNKLRSFSNYPIILINEKLIDIKDYNIIYIPYNTVNSNGLLKCIKQKNIIIDNKKINKTFLIGLIDNIKIDNVDVILNTKLIKEILW